MGDFFNGWRRKTGLVTLAMACVFAAGWMRSHIADEMVYFQISPEGTIFESVDGSLFWAKCKPGSFPDPVGFWQLEATSDPNCYYVLEDGDVKWHLRLLGFGVGESSKTMQPQGRRTYSFWCVPYWSIVLPMTLLSAWLIIMKPKKTKEPPDSATI